MICVCHADTVRALKSFGASPVADQLPVWGYVWFPGAAAALLVFDAYWLWKSGPSLSHPQGRA
jgi:hypothetical protein